MQISGNGVMGNFLMKVQQFGENPEITPLPLQNLATL